MNKILKIYFYISLLLFIFFFGFSSAYYKFFPYDLIIKPLGSISNFIISKKYKDQYMNYNDQELKVYNKFISLNLANLPFDFVLTLDEGSSNNDMFYLKKNNFFQKIPKKNIFDIASGVIDNNTNEKLIIINPELQELRLYDLNSNEYSKELKLDNLIPHHYGNLDYKKNKLFLPSRYFLPSDNNYLKNINLSNECNVPIEDIISIDTNLNIKTVVESVKVYEQIEKVRNHNLPCHDPFHLNDIFVIDTDIPNTKIKKDDLMVSYNTGNFVAIVEPFTSKVKFFILGQLYDKNIDKFIGQHSPIIINDTIFIFDNLGNQKNKNGKSRILQYNFSKKLIYQYTGNKNHFFHSANRSFIHHYYDKLRKKDIFVVVSSKQGEIFEIVGRFKQNIFIEEEINFLFSTKSLNESNNQEISEIGSFFFNF